MPSKNRYFQDKLRHTSKRLYQRWGIDMSPQQIDQIVNKAIQNGDSVCLGAHSNRVTVHRVALKRADVRTGDEDEVEIVFNYDKKASTVITALAEDMDPRIIEPYDDG